MGLEEMMIVGGFGLGVAGGYDFGTGRWELPSALLVFVGDRKFFFHCDYQSGVFQEVVVIVDEFRGVWSWKSFLLVVSVGFCRRALSGKRLGMRGS